MAKKRKREKETKQITPSDELILEWTIHLAKRQPIKAIFATAVIAFTVAFGWVFVHWVVASVMFLVLLGAVSEFLFPIRYKLTKAGIEVTGFLISRRIEWTRIRRIMLMPDGLHLSPFIKPSKLSAFRGLTLRWGEDEAGLKRLYGLCEQLSRSSFSGAE